MARGFAMKWAVPAATALALCGVSLSGWVAGPAASQAAKGGEQPLYRNPSAPIERRIEDLLSRMTLEEKVAQMVAIWEHKDRIQTPDGTFSPERASAAFPNGLGMISRPSDRRGVAAPAATGARARLAPRARISREATMKTRSTRAGSQVEASAIDCGKLVASRAT